MVSPLVAVAAVGTGVIGGVVVFQPGKYRALAGLVV
jgi:hypothetical protein